MRKATKDEKIKIEEYVGELKKMNAVMARRNSPKRDGSGRGTRANRGRGGCSPTRRTGRGSNRR
jgi:hypothetical protein